jgi:hypothetical protein
LWRMVLSQDVVRRRLRALTLAYAREARSGC